MLRMAKTARCARALRPLIRARSLFKRRRDDVLVSRTMCILHERDKKAKEEIKRDREMLIINNLLALGIKRYALEYLIFFKKDERKYIAHILLQIKILNINQIYV